MFVATGTHTHTQARSRTHTHKHTPDLLGLKCHTTGHALRTFPPLSSVEVHTRQAVVVLGRRADDWTAIAECCGLKAGATDLAVSVAQSHRGAPCAGMSSPLRLGVPEREAGGRTHTAPARRLLTPTTSETSSLCRFKDGLAWLTD